MSRLVLLLTLVAAPLQAQDSVEHAPSITEPAAPPRFTVGEEFVYQVKFGIFSIGRARMSVLRQDSVRGRPVTVLQLSINGRALFFSLNDTLTSWTGRYDLRSYKFRQANNEDGRYTVREYNIDPDSQIYRRTGMMEHLFVSVADPLDDIGFFYWVRTLPLEVGKSYSWDRYFMPDKNPVRIRVLKRQGCELPGDVKRQCLLIQPSIKSSGMLSEASDARLLITDDAERIPVQVRSSFSFGTLTLNLKSVARGTPAASTP